VEPEEHPSVDPAGGRTAPRGDGGMNGVHVDDPVPGQAGEDRRPLRLIALDVAGLAAEADRQLRHDPPGEVLQTVGSLVANGDDRGRQPLDVAVLVPAHRPRVVRRDDATADLAARPAIWPDDD